MVVVCYVWLFGCLIWCLRLLVVGFGWVLCMVWFCCLNWCGLSIRVLLVCLRLKFWVGFWVCFVFCLSVICLFITRLLDLWVLWFVWVCFGGYAV